MKKQKRILAGGILSAALLTFGAVSLVTIDSSAEASKLSVATSASSSKSTMITAEKAKEIALKEASGTIDDIDLEKHNGTTYYEVEIEQGNTDVTVQIDAYTGEVLNVYKDLDFEVVASDVDVKISMEEAKKTALSKLENSTVTKAELDLDDGVYVYDIEVENDTYEADVTIDANTGEVLSFDQDRRDDVEVDSSSSSSSSANVKISLETAKKTALAKLSNSTVTSAELDYDDGLYVYEIEVKNSKYEADVEINANTGKVISFEKERRDD